MSSDSEDSDWKTPINLATSGPTSIPANPAYSRSYDALDAFPIAVCGLLGVGRKNIVRDHFHDWGIVISPFEHVHGDYDATKLPYNGKNVQVHFETCLAFPLHNTNFEALSLFLVPATKITDAIIIVYDVTNRASFRAVPVLHRIARAVEDVEPGNKNYCSRKQDHPIPSARKPIIIMANKCDLPEKEWAVKRKEGQRLGNRDSATIFMEVSAKTGLGLEKVGVLTNILDQIYLARKETYNAAGGEKKSVGTLRSMINRFLVRIKGILKG